MMIAPQQQGPGAYSPPMAERSSAVQMGRQDYFSVVLRLIGMELYKLRRRMMSKILMLISALTVVVVFIVVMLATLVIIQRSGIAFVSPSPLLPPLSLYIAIQAALPLGEVLLIVLVGSIVGGEYGVGTVRLMMTRGPSRTQFLLAKIGAVLVCVVVAVVGMVVLGLLMGLLLNLSTGIGVSFDFFTAAWFGHALLYVLITMLSLFVYSMLALFLATLGRATAAGIAGALVWLLVGEGILGTLLTPLGRLVGGAFGDFLHAIPDYFITTNTGALLQNQTQYLNLDVLGLSVPSPISDLHALIVLAIYLVIFIGLSWWVIERRDVTN